jgi:Primase X
MKKINAYNFGCNTTTAANDGSQGSQGSLQIRNNCTYPSDPACNAIISDAVDFILGHFEVPIFPRTISTHTTRGRQILVYNKEEAIARYKQANLLDCRINAYPDYTEYHAINRQAPNFILMDIDKSNFKTERTHNQALSTTLQNIKEKLGSSPTVLWSGNGYHIYQPVDSTILEQIEIFSKFDQPSKAFLRFAENYLTNNKSDPSHHPSFKSCMIRIPGSYNSKCILSRMDPEVRVIQKWNHHRPKIKLLLGSFYAYLVDQQTNEIQLQRRLIKHHYQKDNNIWGNSSIHWIEKLLETPIADYRKNAISLILAPYLVNIKKISYSDTHDIIKEWLNKCDQVKQLDSDFNYRIKYTIENSIRNNFKPIKLETLKDRNKLLYDVLVKENLQLDKEVGSVI